MIPVNLIQSTYILKRYKFLTSCQKKRGEREREGHLVQCVSPKIKSVRGKYEMKIKTKYKTKVRKLL